MKFEDVMSSAEAAERWGLSPTTVKQACSGQRSTPPRFTKGECRKSKGTWLVTRQGMERLYGELTMFKLMHNGKTIGSYSTAWDALNIFIELEEKNNHATDLVWCGTDKTVYFDVVGEEPNEELTEKSYILCDGDNIALIHSSDNLYDIKKALDEVNADFDIIEDLN